MLRVKLLVFMALTVQIFSAQTVYDANIKNRYDLNQEISPVQFKSASLNDSKLAIKTEVWQYTLMDGGYFTIGLNNGKYPASIDNQCELTFGHPFAFTSFAYPVVDGITIDPRALLANDNIALTKRKDSVIYQVWVTPDIVSKFVIHTAPQQNLQLDYTLENTGSESHQVGGRILFDAALGKWGDGYIIQADTVLNKTGKLAAIPDTLLLFERGKSPRGIGLKISFGENKPSQLIAGNWINLFQDKPDNDKFYDLAIKNQWEHTTLEQGEKVTYSLLLTEAEPDYDGSPFVRWNLPNALSIENNMLFPLSLATIAEIQSASPSGDISFNLVGEPYISELSDASNSTLTDTITYANIEVNFQENYDSVITPLTLRIVQNGQYIDELIRNVLIPGAPFSNEGLTVTIDTVYQDNGNIALIFKVVKDENGQLLYSLSKNNIFFYLNDLPINDFTVAKDTSNGINQADIVFILDVTGSMGNEIASVRSNIIEFTDSLTMKGVDYRLGMVTFLDEIENIYEFTSDADVFKGYVEQQYAHGGGDYPENSLEALYQGATHYQFRGSAKRIFIWITDASYHINNDNTSLTKAVVTDALLEKGIVTHCIGNASEQLYYYDQIVLNTGGSFYDINGNFRDILLDVSRLGQLPEFILSFNPETMTSGADLFKVEVHYAGLGGSDTVSLGNTDKSRTFNDNKAFAVYPIPVNQTPTLNVLEDGNYNVTYELISITGKVIYQNSLQNVSSHDRITLTGLASFLENSNQPMLLKLDIYDTDKNLIDSQRIKIIR
ncbi:VWA domain-containing protein [Saccharicrinis sp. FJH54]|uniref:vWA domain-containing protein n=1 Tax=Saccharicrinis sp. FJH54 TaxID=3344665 RepID=UPI0035D4B865